MRLHPTKTRRGYARCDRIAQLRIAAKFHLFFHVFQFCTTFAARSLALRSNDDPFYGSSTKVTGTANLLQAISGLRVICSALMTAKDRSRENNDWLDRSSNRNRRVGTAPTRQQGGMGNPTDRNGTPPGFDKIPKKLRQLVFTSSAKPDHPPNVAETECFPHRLEKTMQTRLPASNAQATDEPGYPQVRF